MDHASTEAAGLNALSEIIRQLLVLSVEAIVTANFLALFNISRVHFKQFLEWILSSNNVQQRKCGRDEGSDKRSFEAVEAKNVCGLS